MPEDKKLSEDMIINSLLLEIFEEYQKDPLHILEKLLTSNLTMKAFIKKGNLESEFKTYKKQVKDIKDTVFSNSDSHLEKEGYN